MIPKEGVQEVYEWTQEEILYGGFIGQKRYRVPLKFGTKIQMVKFQNIIVGLSEVGNKNCLPAALRHCSDKCDGVYGMSCAWGQACNPLTHVCEKAGP